jgi:hypothetical protein
VTDAPRGSESDVEVTSVLQTSAVRMIFARLVSQSHDEMCCDGRSIGAV